MTRPPRPSRRAHARRRRFVGSRRLFLAVGLLLASWYCPLPTRRRRLGPSLLPLSEGLLQPPNQETRCASVGCHSAVSQQYAGHGSLSVKLSVRRQSAASLRVFFGSIHSFSKYSKQPTFIAPRFCAKSGGGAGPSGILHTYLHLISQQILIGWQLSMN